jgi:prefoldin subunit 5
MTLAGIRRVLALEAHVRQLQAELEELRAQQDKLRAAVAERDALLRGRPGGRG